MYEKNAQGINILPFQCARARFELPALPQVRQSWWTQKHILWNALCSRGLHLFECHLCAPVGRTVCTKEQDDEDIEQWTNVGAIFFTRAVAFAFAGARWSFRAAAVSNYSRRFRFLRYNRRPWRNESTLCPIMICQLLPLRNIKRWIGEAGVSEDQRVPKQMQ